MDALLRSIEKRKGGVMEWYNLASQMVDASSDKPMYSDLMDDIAKCKGAILQDSRSYR
jgi:hypothetical protein